MFYTCFFWLFYVKSSPFSIEKRRFFIEKSVFLGTKLCFSADVLEFFIFGSSSKLAFSIKFALPPLKIWSIFVDVSRDKMGKIGVF